MLESLINPDKLLSGSGGSKEEEGEDDDHMPMSRGNTVNLAAKKKKAS